MNAQWRCREITRGDPAAPCIAAIFRYKKSLGISRGDAMKRGALIGALILAMVSGALAAGMGNITDAQRQAHGVVVRAGSDQLIVRAITDRVVNIEYRQAGEGDADTPVVEENKLSQAAHATVQTEGQRIVVKTDKFSVLIARQPCRLSLYDSLGKLLLEEQPDGGAFVDANDPRRGGLRFQHGNGEHFYGVKAYSIGEWAKSAGARTLLRDGAEVDGHQYQANAATQGDAAAPFIWTTAGYGILVDSDNGYFVADEPRLEFYYGTPSQETNGRRYEKKNSVKYYLIVGEPKQLLAGEMKISGGAPMFPKWAAGFTNSQWGITQDQLITIVDTYRAHDIPIDNFTLDFDWKAWGEDDFGEFRWNDKKFPAAVNAEGKAQTLKAKMDEREMKITGIMKPRIIRFNDKEGKNPTQQGREADEKKFWYAGAERHRDYFSGRDVGELDFSIPACREWYWNATKTHGAMQSGIVGFWNDEADEADFGGGHHFIFNNFEHMQMQQALYEGQRAWNEDGHTISRVWSLNRNFYLGAQRYAYAMWSGDISTGFETMRRQATRMLAAVSIGEAKWSMDTGGFNGTPSPENYARWVQFSALCPICRVHGTYQEHRQPWVYGEEAETIAKDALRRRYQFAPYIYACEREAFESGVGVVRPLHMEFPDDSGAADVTDEWMFGDSILAAPVLSERATTRSIYLPSGNWIDYFRGDVLTGGKRIDYPINIRSWSDVPMFVRRGSIIVTQDAVSALNSAKPDHYYLDAFPGNTEGATTIYDDDGESYAYESGTFFKQPVTVKGTTITIASREGTYPSPIRYYILRVHGSAATSATMDGKPMEQSAWSRAKDVYGDVTIVRAPAGLDHETRIELAGNEPVKSDGEIVEMEDGSLSGETTDTRVRAGNNHTGFSGRGFAAGFSHPWGAATVYVKRHAAGEYPATLRIANNSGERTLSLYINGKKTRTVTIPATGNWDHWQDVDLPLQLAAGNNVLMLRRDPQDTGGVNVDYVKIPFESR
jgi:alpha-glucosidase (family GH31 glycosyl hydrolase)